MIADRNSSALFILVITIFAVTAMHLPADAATKNKAQSIPMCKDNSSCITAEIAATPEAWSRGLMFRDRLSEIRGMLFVFPRSDFWLIWMKNTKMPLDILWMDGTGRIVSIAANAQPCMTDPCRDYVPKDKALYVLEMTSGMVRKWNLKIGDRLVFTVPEAPAKDVR